MTTEERQKLIEEKEALVANLSSPSDLRRVGQIRSLLLTNGETETLTFSASKPTDSYFSKRTMSGFTNRRR